MTDGNSPNFSILFRFSLLLSLLLICIAFPLVLKKHSSHSVVEDGNGILHLSVSDNPARDPQNVIPVPFPSSTFGPNKSPSRSTPWASATSSPSFRSEPDKTFSPSAFASRASHPQSPHASTAHSSFVLQPSSHGDFVSFSPQPDSNLGVSSVVPSRPLTEDPGNDVHETTGKEQDCIYFGEGEVPGFTLVDESWLSGNVSTYTAPSSAFPNLPKQFQSYMYIDTWLGSVWSVAIPVPADQEYSLSLGFAEINEVGCSYENDTGFRVFKASVFGQSEIVDVMHEVGCGVPLHVRFDNVDISASGKLRLNFEGITESAMVSTICYSPTAMKTSSASPTSTESVFPTVIVTPVPSPPSTSNPRYSDIIQPSAGSFSCINFGDEEMTDYELFNRSLVIGDVELYNGKKVDQHGRLPLAYQTFIFGKNWSYKLVLPTTLMYTIVLGFVEMTPEICTGPRFAGERVFTANLASGMQIVDVMASVGCAVPYQSFFENVSSANGIIDVSFKAFSGSAMLSVICYSNEPQSDDSTSSGSPSPSSSPALSPLASAYASRSADEAHKDTGYDESNKDSKFNCYNFGDNTVNGFKNVNAPKGDDAVGSYLSSNATVYPISPHHEVYRSHLYGLKLSLNITSNTTVPKSLIMGFAETYTEYCKYDARVFDVQVGPIIRTLDVFREVGCSKAFTIRIDGVLPDSNGIISIMLTSRYKQAMISGICIQDGEEEDILRQYSVSAFPNPTSVSVSSKFSVLISASIAYEKPKESNDESVSPEQPTSGQASPSLSVTTFQSTNPSGTINATPGPISLSPSSYPSSEASPSPSLYFSVEGDPKPAGSPAVSNSPSASSVVLIIDAESPSPSMTLASSQASPSVTRDLLISSSVSPKSTDVLIVTAPSMNPEPSVEPSKSAQSSTIASESGSTVPFPAESEVSNPSPTSSSSADKSQTASELAPTFAYPTPTVVIEISAGPSASESFSFSPIASSPPMPSSSISTLNPTITLIPITGSASVSSTPLLSVSSTVSFDAFQMPSITPVSSFVSSASQSLAMASSTTSVSSEEDSYISSSPSMSSGLEIVPGPSVSSSASSLSSTSTWPTPEISMAAGVSITPSSGVFLTNFPSTTPSASQTLDENGSKNPENNPSPSSVVVIGGESSVAPSPSTLPISIPPILSSLGPSSSFGGVTVSPVTSIDILLPSHEPSPSDQLFASNWPIYSLEMTALPTYEVYSTDSPNENDELFIYPAISVIQSETAEVYPSHSSEPSPSYNSDTYVMPTPWEEESFPSAPLDQSPDLVTTPWAEESLVFTPVARSPDVVIGAGDESGIVQDSGDSSSSSDNGSGPAIVEGSPWKELIGTGSAGKAFPVLMGITGVLLVLLLLLCLYFAIFRSGPATYSYPSQYSEIYQNRTGYEDDGFVGKVRAGGVTLDTATESMSETDHFRSPSGYDTQQIETSSPGYESPLHTGSASFYGQHRQNDFSGAMESEARALDIHTTPTGNATSESVVGLEEPVEAENIYVGTNDLTFEQSRYESHGIDSGNLSRLSNPLHSAVFDETRRETLNVSHEHAVTFSRNNFVEYGNTIENVYYESGSALYQENALSECQQPNEDAFVDEQDNTLPVTGSHGENEVGRAMPFQCSFTNGNMEMDYSEDAPTSLPRSVADDYESCGSNPAITPYESCMEPDDTAAGSRGSELKKRRTFFIHRESGPADNTMLDDADGEEFETLRRSRMSRRFFVDRVGNSHSEVSTAEGPWPAWWAHENAHKHIHDIPPPKEEGDGESLCNSSQIADSNETEISKENSSLPSNDDYDGGRVAAHDVNHDGNAGYVSHENIDPKTAGAVFGGGQLLSDNAWLRQRGSNNDEMWSPNPEFDYLRKRREPYVKAVANRLSMGLPRRSGEGTELAELAIPSNGNSFDEMNNYTIDHYGQQF